MLKKIYHNAIISFIFHTLGYCLNKELSGCHSVLDLGCGNSSPLQYCTDITYSLGVETFEQYLEESKRKKIHTEYLKRRIEDLDFPKNSFDAVIMIEVIEHLPEEIGLQIIKKAENWAKKKIIVTSPNGFIRQDSLDKNLFQIHLSGWKVKKMKELGFKSYGLAGLKILRKEVQSDTMGDDMMTTIRFNPKPLWFVIAALSQTVTYFIPSLAFEIFHVRNK